MSKTKKEENFTLSNCFCPICCSTGNWFTSGVPLIIITPLFSYKNSNKVWLLFQEVCWKLYQIIVFIFILKLLLKYDIGKNNECFNYFFNFAVGYRKLRKTLFFMIIHFFNSIVFSAFIFDFRAEKIETILRTIDLFTETPSIQYIGVQNNDLSIILSSVCI